MTVYRRVDCRDLGFEVVVSPIISGRSYTSTNTVITLSVNSGNLDSTY